MFIHQLFDPKDCATLTKLCFLTALSSRDAGKENEQEASEAFKQLSDLSVEAIDYCEQEMLGRLITTFLPRRTVTGDSYALIMTNFFYEEVKPVLPSTECLGHLSDGVREAIYFDIATKILNSMAEKGEFASYSSQMKKLFFFECCVMSYVNGTCSKNEKEFLRLLGENFNIGKTSCDELTELATRYIEVFAETADIISE